MELKDNINDGYRKIFESAPDLYLLLSPALVIIDASNGYLSATMTRRDEIRGRGLFEVFPDNPDDPQADGVSNLSISLNTVLQNHKPDIMDIQKYDIPRPDGVFETRYWKPTNTPVLNEQQEVIYILHKVEDVTEQQLLKKASEDNLKQKDELQAVQKGYIESLRESEARFHKIFDLCPVALYMTDILSGKMMYVNKAFENMFFLESKDIVGKTSVEIGIIDEQHRATLQKEIRERGGKVRDLEADLRIGTGEIRNMLISVEIIELDGRKCFFAAMVDITYRRQMEDALNKANHFLDTILEHIPDMVFVKDATDLRFVRFNKAGEQMLGFPSTDLIGRNDYDFFPPEQADAFIEKDRAVLREQKLFTIDEEPIQTKYGERWLHTKKIPIIENGKPLYLVGISADITEQKKHQDAILNLNKELESFSYSVSHDLRTPLRAITGYAKILEEDYAAVVDDEGKRFLRTISQNAVKMGNLIDDLLQFSRLGKKELQKKETNAALLVEAAIVELNRAAQNNADIKVNVTHSIDSDESLMKLVFINLIGNAIKYSSKKESPLVEIESRDTGTDILFSIKDNGVGFDMRYVDKLFGVFQRLHTSDEFEGTGVGLAIVQRIIKKHGGKIWVEAKLNEGATFYFSIPKN